MCRIRVERLKNQKWNVILFVQPSPIQEQIPRLLIECVQFREDLQLLQNDSDQRLYTLFYAHDDVTEALHWTVSNDIEYFLVSDRCPLCLGGSPQAFHVLFQVLSGVTERLRYSLPTRLLCSQYILSYKLCGGVHPQVFRAIF